MEEEQQSDQSATVRLNGSMLKDYIGSIVRVVGKAGAQMENGNFSLVTSNDSIVTVVRSTDTPVNEGDVIEVIGTVSDETTLAEVLIVHFDKSFGLVIHPTIINSHYCFIFYSCSLPFYVRYAKLWSSA